MIQRKFLFFCGSEIVNHSLTKPAIVVHVDVTILRYICVLVMVWVVTTILPSRVGIFSSSTQFCVNLECPTQTLLEIFACIGLGGIGLTRWPCCIV